MVPVNEGMEREVETVTVSPAEQADVGNVAESVTL
jgi:hypothetical protein